MIPVLLLLATLDFRPAQIEAPKPKPVAVHEYWDRLNKIELIAGGSIATADMAQTCHSLANGGHEYNLPTQNCGTAIAINLGAYAAGEALAYLLHRTGHYKLERLPVAYLIYGNTRGIIFSKIHGAW